MRKLASLCTVGLLSVGASAYAAVPGTLKCGSTPLASDCFQEEVFVVDGSAMVGDKPIVVCKEKAMMPGVVDPANCTFDADLATAHMLEKLGGQGGPWDQIVVFGADIADSTTPNGPLFYRVGGDDGVNEVSNIGIGSMPGAPKVPRVAGKPYVGIIHAGGTSQISNPASGAYGTCGTLPRRIDLDQPTKANQPRPTLCPPGFHTFFDALAQATAAQFGPYLTGPGMPMANSDLNVWPEIKGGLVNDMGGSKVTGVMRPRIWNSFLNLKGSLLGGNTFRDNGNATFETTKPPLFLGVTPPLGNAQGHRFQPIDLYVMGFAPSSEVAPIEHFMAAKEGDVYKPVGVAKFNEVVGPRMGTRQAVAVRATARGVLNFAEVVAANGGERDPSYQTAPHYLRQLWVVVKKPQAVLDATGAADAVMKNDAAATNVVTWRRNWNQYFYTLTSYRARMITTFEGNVDDMPYWEFGNAADDGKAFAGDSGFSFPGNIAVPNSSDRKSVMVVDAAAGATIHTMPSPFPIRISGSQSLKTPINSVSIRLMIPRGNAPFLKAFSQISFENGPTVRIPNFEKAFLIPDGKFRTYSANLSDKTDFTGGEFTGMSFTPSNIAINGMEIEFIRVANVGSPKDSDLECPKVPQKAARKALPDGFIDSEDNCPGLYNPDQADGNEDGIGDACEDFDGDLIPNACDNCPTITNSQQQDSDNDKLGDVCDPDTSAGCFLHPSAVGGNLPASPGALTGAVLLGLAGLFATRRRRRR